MMIRKANERGHASLGWLDTCHTFSFADYYDPRWMGYRSLRVINDDVVMPQSGFPTHPHRNMEILTYILSGSLEHRYSMENGRVIHTGDVQYMSAGTGVRHSEWNPSTDEAVHLLQIWIEPDREGYAPRYEDRSFAQASPGRLHLVASHGGRDGSIAIRQDADLWIARLRPEERVEATLAAGRHAWLHAATGELTVNGETLREGDAAAIDGPADMVLTATKPTQVLLFDLN